MNRPTGEMEHLDAILNGRGYVIDMEWKGVKAYIIHLEFENATLKERVRGLRGEMEYRKKKHKALAELYNVTVGLVD